MTAPHILASASILIVFSAAATAQRRPDFETVPADELMQAEQRLKQSRATWEAAARNLERDILVKDADEMHARVQRARDKKRDELASRRSFFTTFAAQTGDVVDTLKAPSPLMSAKHFRTALEAIADRQADIDRQISKLAQSTKPADVATRVAMQVQANRLKTLLQTIQDELATHQTAEEEERARQEANDNALRAMKSARDRFIALAEDVEQEQALWDRYYDTLDDTVERNRPVKRTPKIQ